MEGGEKLLLLRNLAVRYRSAGQPSVRSGKGRERKQNKTTTTTTTTTATENSACNSEIRFCELTEYYTKGLKGIQSTMRVISVGTRHNFL